MEGTVSKRRFRMVVPKYPAFNVYSNAARKTTALGPLCIATAVSKLPNWEVEVIDENNYRFPGPLDEEGQPDHQWLQELRPADVVGFYGGLSCTVPRLYKLASAYRDWGVLTVGGGQHLDFLPQEALENGLDVVVHGEGEQTICDVLTTWQQDGDLDQVPGISHLSDSGMQTTASRPPVEHFDEFAVPDFGLIRFAHIKIFPVNRIRGCSRRCEFCSVKGQARCARPEWALGQFSYLAETFGARKFFVVDDHFAQDREETLRFCHLLAHYQQRMNLRFFIFAQTRLDAARDRELLDVMWACGIRVLAIGYESPIDEDLRAMGKGQRAEQMLAWTAEYRSRGFVIHGMFIFGYPRRKAVGDSLTLAERVKRYKKFIRAARLDTVQLLHPVPLPGTALRQRLETEDRIFPLSEFGWEYYDGNFPLIKPDPPLTAEQLQTASISILRRFYRFWNMFVVGLRALIFPFAMLPLTNLSGRFMRWYRPWRKNILGFVGWSIVRKWRKGFRRNPYREKLSRFRSLNNHQPPTSSLSP